MTTCKNEITDLFVSDTGSLRNDKNLASAADVFQSFLVRDPS